MINVKDVKQVEIDLVNHCNLSCSICARQQDVGKSLKKGTNLNNENILFFLSHLPNLKIVDLVGSYSEPTFYSDFLTLVQDLKSAGYKLRIGTNGNTRNREFWTSFGQLLSKDDIVRFGVDGSTQAIHSRYRTGGNLLEVLANHRAFKESSRAITVLQNIIFEHNENDVEQIKKLFLDEGFDFLELTHTGKPYSNNEDGLSLPVESLQKRHTDLEKILHGMKIAKFDCQSVKHSQLYLSHTGIVLPCDDLEESVLKQYVSGEKIVNIIDNSIEQCLEFVNHLIRRRALSGECHRACCEEAQLIKTDYPVLQCSRDLKFMELINYRGVLSEE